MHESKENTHHLATRFISVMGALPSLSAKNLKRISVYLVQGSAILSETAVSASGTFQLYVAPHLANDATVFAVIGPQGLDAQTLASHADLPRAGLSGARELEGGGLQLDLSALKINDKIIEPWWLWCREYTVSGTLLTAAGCPIGAEVTVYNVTSGVSGLVATALDSVSTGPDGKFTATFNWCSSRFCWWPCLPFWWHCWPWWWELDILTVIENVESRLQAQTRGVSAFSNVAPLRQPNAADLMTGVGFAGSRATAELKPDAARAALIATKLANPAIRELFPWWWWCCENPNILFSASQDSTVILNEDPNTSTRWCFASGQNVSLTGNSESVGACQIHTGGPCGFAWSSVGDEPGGILTDNISLGYAEGTAGGDCSDLAFNGSLNLNGVFGGDCIAFYQVLNGQWGGNGNPARGGTPPATSHQLSEELVDTITYWSSGISKQVPVVLGPCSYKGIDNLYMTRSQRPNPPAGVTGLPPFPTIPPGDLWGWDAPDLVLTVPASDLVSPASSGGATLSLVPYDIHGNALPTVAQPVTMGPNLTLMIDTTSLTGKGGAPAPTIDSVAVFNSDGTPATPTTGSSTQCPAYQITTPDGGYVLIHTTVVDKVGHLCEYFIQTQYGSGSYAPATPSYRGYAQPVSSFTPPSSTQLYGVDSGYNTPNDSPPPPPAPQIPAATDWIYVGGGDTIQIPITQSCCYDFQLWVSKRTTDGQTFACSQGNPTFQTVNILVAPAAT